MSNITIHKSKCIITMDNNNSVLLDACIIILNDKIIDVGKYHELIDKYPGSVIVDHGDSVIMPGLINAHSHSGLLRGTAEYLPLWEWLQVYVDPMHRVLNKDEAEAASYLCYSEQVLSGITTTVDMWRFMDTAAEACRYIGNRVIIVPYVGEHHDYNFFDTLDDNENLINAVHESAAGRVNVWVGIEHMLYGTKDAYKRIVHLCNYYDTCFHTHSNETKDDVSYIKKSFGVDPIEIIYNHGLLSLKKTLLAHCVWLTDNEVKILADNNVGVAHNPISNMKLASGCANIKNIISSGIAVGIGTDGEKENNNMDLFDSVKTASLLAKFNYGNTSVIDHWDLMKCITIEGARAIGMDDVIGSIEVGKKADFIVINTNTPRLTPLLLHTNFNVHNNIIHSMKSEDVCYVVINGEAVVIDGKLVNVDLSNIISSANINAKNLLARRDQWLLDNNEVIKNRLNQPLEK